MLVFIFILFTFPCFLCTYASFPGIPSKSKPQKSCKPFQHDLPNQINSSVKAPPSRLFSIPLLQMSHICGLPRPPVTPLVLSLRPTPQRRDLDPFRFAVLLYFSLSLRKPGSKPPPHTSACFLFTSVCVLLFPSAVLRVFGSSSYCVKPVTDSY